MVTGTRDPRPWRFCRRHRNQPLRGAAPCSLLLASRLATMRTMTCLEAPPLRPRRPQRRRPHRGRRSERRLRRRRRPRRPQRKRPRRGDARRPSPLRTVTKTIRMMTSSWTTTRRRSRRHPRRPSEPLGERPSLRLDRRRSTFRSPRGRRTDRSRKRCTRLAMMTFRTMLLRRCRRGVLVAGGRWARQGVLFGQELGLARMHRSLLAALPYQTEM